MVVAFQNLPALPTLLDTNLPTRPPSTQRSRDALPTVFSDPFGENVHEAVRVEENRQKLKPGHKALAQGPLAVRGLL